MSSAKACILFDFNRQLKQTAIYKKKGKLIKLNRKGLKNLHRILHLVGKHPPK